MVWRWREHVFNDFDTELWTDQTTTDGFWQKEVKDIFKRDFVFLELHVIQRFKHIKCLDKPQ